MVDFRDPKGRLAGYFIWNTDDGKFLTHTTPRGVAHAGMALADVAGADYLDINIGIPVFSPKAVELFERFAADEMTFYSCVIECKGQDFPFFLVRINKRVAVVDKARSTFRSLTDGEQVLSGAVFRSTFDEDFLIARDVDFRVRWPCRQVSAICAFSTSWRSTLSTARREPICGSRQSKEKVELRNDRQQAWPVISVPDGSR